MKNSFAKYRNENVFNISFTGILFENDKKDLETK